MANEQQPTRGTLGLTGLTMNAMALIAPGAFLWLTFQMQSLYGAPMAGSAMWFGILFALLLCLATAYSYAELSKLYPGPGSSYLYAEQAFLSKTKAFKFARIAKFVTGWASHLYYWVYPGVMVGVTALLAGFLLNQFWPDTFSGTYNSPLFMWLFCIIFALGVAYIAFRGVTGTTAVNVVINIVQISALLVFSVIAIGYRTQHPQGSTGYHLSNGVAVTYQVAQEPVKDDKGQPVPVMVDGKPSLDKDGKPVYQMQDMKDEKSGDPIGADKDGKPVKDLKLAAPFTVDYADGAITKDDKGVETFNYHKDAKSVVAPHGFNYIFIQAAIAILILVGFETVTAMADEAKNPKKDVPRAVLLSLVIQGAVCYLIEYFAANYMLHNGYTMPNAGASGAPLGDMMVITGTWLFGSAAAGKAFMLVQAFTVFLALIGTTLSCLSTGARVTYAMGRDEEVPSHFGLLHGKTMSPYKAIWALAVISAIIGIVTVSVYQGGTTPAALDKHNFWYSIGIFAPELYAKLPNTLVIVTLISNFGTFLLYMITCWIAMVAFKEHHTFNTFKHVVIPVFGLLANFVIMLFYLIGPFMVSGMSWKEPYIALGVVAVWGIYGALYFLRASKAKGKEVLLSSRPVVSH
ncbi:APC family permease [Geobacter argillaceus]|uniref:Amino acid permease-like protein n=1 Tax=Geobacter argillaceus TaxID=345631 RepID=A0A562W885_9BACT|nr:APC family permease [Geobacter argillaceus]TWJ26503.1 amino acid permease-like protein [Geobacter argillaceus]